MMDLDSEPKSTNLSPSHRFTLWTLQSQSAIVMIFWGKIIQRLHISKEVLTISELKFRNLRGYMPLLIFSAAGLDYTNFPTFTDQTAFYSQPVLLGYSVAILSESLKLQKKFLSSPILCCALCSSLTGDLKLGRGRVSAFRPYLLWRIGLALTNPTHLPLQDVLKQTKMQHRLTSFSKKLNMLLSASSLDSSNFSTACLTSSSGIFPKRFFL